MPRLPPSPAAASPAEPYPSPPAPSPPRGPPRSDPYGGGGSNGNVLGTLMANFEESYNGNRAPFPLFIHSEYLEGNKGDVEAFIGAQRLPACRHVCCC